MRQFWEKNNERIITIVAMILVGTGMHFVCDIFPQPQAVRVLGVLFPVNETLWEHMKLLWYPFLGAGVVLFVKKRDAGYFGGFVLGGIAAVLLIIGAFAFYQSFTQTSVLAVDISLYVVDIVVCAMLAFLLAAQPWCRRAPVVWIVLAVIVTAAVIYLTYHPATGYVFRDGD